VRTSVETWTATVELLTAPDQAARASLEAITNVAALLIAEEYTRDAPIVVIPATGDRLRIYTVHGTAAIESETETPLATWPLTEPGWRLSLPCGIDDIEDIRAALRPHPFIDVRDVTEGIAVDAAADPGGSTPHSAGTVTINYDELERS
jgi:hypothetical protein